jgi:hypothetical protein
MNVALLGTLAAAAIALAPRVVPPSVTLELVAPTTRGPWRVRVTNISTVPVRIVADLRLLSLDVTPRSARTIRCVLPDDMRPADDVEHRLVVPPGRSFAASFDPRLYCFGGSRMDAIAPGSVVVAHLGFGGASRLWSRIEMRPLETDLPSSGSIAAVLDSAPIAVPDEPTVMPTTSGRVAVDPPTGAPDSLDVPRLHLEGARAFDAENPSVAEISVTLENRGPKSVIVRFRPETLAFDVEGPGGHELCVWPFPPPAPALESYTTLTPHERTTLSVLLGSYCRGQSLLRPGLLFVRPSLDTTSPNLRFVRPPLENVSTQGHDIDARAFSGIVVSTTPTLLRMRHTIRYLAPPELPEPELEPIASPALLDASH